MPAPAILKRAEESAINALRNTSTRLDNWVNTFTGLGTTQDKRVHTRFVQNIELPYAEKSAIFRQDPIGGRICNLPPREMVREWVVFANDQSEKFEAKCKTLGVRRHAYEGLLWARTFGGAVTVMGLQDGRKAEREVDVESLAEIKFMQTLDASQIVVESRDPSSGEPETFRILRSDDPTDPRFPARAYPAETVIHKSRCLVWQGELVPPGERQASHCWGGSILDRCVNGLRDFNGSHHSAAVIMADFSQAVFKIDNLSGMLRSNAENNNLVLQRLQLLDFCRSVLRAIPIDAARESFERVSTPTSGLPDLLDRIGIYLSCITGIPYTLLLGESPNGLNATGQGDHRNFYNSISADQEWGLRPNLEYVFFIIAMCKAYRLGGALKNAIVPFGFRPLWQPSDKDRAETQYLVAKADDLDIRNGKLTPAEARSRYRAGGFSLDIVTDSAVKASEQTIDLAKQAKDAANAANNPPPAGPDPTPNPTPSPDTSGKATGNQT
jgi:phage-related protein (TIGR01555 family)